MVLTSCRIGDEAVFTGEGRRIGLLTMLEVVRYRITVRGDMNFGLFGAVSVVRKRFGKERREV